MNPTTLSDIGVVGVIVGMALALGIAFARGWIVWGSEIAIYKTAAERDAKTITDLLETNAKNAQTMAEWNVAGQLIASQSQALRDSLERS